MTANLLCAERHDDDEQFEFEGDDCLERILDWVRELTVLEEEDEGEWPVIYTIRYDSYFVLDKFFKQKICPDQIMNGVKILSMGVDKLKFIDSICFLQTPLSGFTKGFGLRELKEGFFPNLF